MNVGAINSNISFKNLYNGYTVEKRLENKPSKKFVKNLNETKSLITGRGLDKLENVDILLQVDDKDKFYGVIAPKNEATPMSPNYRCNISKKTEDVNKFANWANEWNELYSREFLNFLEDIIYGSKTPKSDDIAGSSKNL